MVFFGAPLIVWLLLKGEEQCGFPLGAAFLPCVLAYRACRKLSWILPQGGQETEESLYSHDRAGIPGTALGRIYIQNHRTTLMSQRNTSKRLSQSIPNTMYSDSRSLSPRDKISPKDYITVRAINPGFFYLGMDELFLGFYNLMAIFSIILILKMTEMIANSDASQSPKAIRQRRTKKENQKMLDITSSNR